MFDLKRLFAREQRARRNAIDASDTDSDYNTTGRAGTGLEVEYRSLIDTQLRRWGVEAGPISIEIRRIGAAPDGFDVFVGLVRLEKWEKDSALRLLLGLPLLESRVRKSVRATWLADYSHFAGLWLHASERLNQGEQLAALRDILGQVAPRRSRDVGHTIAGTASEPEAQTSSAHSDTPISN